MYKIKKKKLVIPELSIIIPIKDQLPYLDRCLVSLEKTKDITFELILVNDGSNAETVHYLEKFPQLNVLHHQQSKGFIEACHAGANKAIGQFLLFLNSDTELIEPTSFRKMIDVFKFNKNVGVVGSRLLLENNTIQHASLVWDAKQMNYTHRYYGRDRNDPVVCVNETVDIVTGACFMTTKELWDKLGGFDRIYGNGYFEDTDYCLKAKELGLSTVYCGEALLYHYQSKSFSGGPSKEHFARNHEIFKQRWIRNSKVVKYPKVAACYITFNEEEYIEASIKSIYNFVEKIIIVDGSTEANRSFGNVDGSSSDKTLEILEKIEDPKKKITIISHRLWKNKEEQRNTYCEMLQGMDYAFIIDGDEIWDGENLREIEYIIFSNPHIPSFCFNFYDFWGDLGHRSRGVWETFVGRKSLINLNITGGIKYNNHTIPITKDDKDITSVFCKDIYFYHYSYVRSDEKMKQKMDYYINMGTPGFKQQEDWFNKVWLGWKKGRTFVEQTYGTHLFGGGWTEIWTGDHPEVMKSHPRYIQYLDKYKTKINMTVNPQQRDNFINVSLKNDDVFDISKKIGDKKSFLIIIEDLLEHISFNAVGGMLVKLYDKMELNGEIVIKTYNLQEILKRYNEGKMQYTDFVKIMYGEQIESQDYHSICYDENAIKALLEDVGFSFITIDKIENGLFLYAIGRKVKELS